MLKLLEIAAAGLVGTSAMILVMTFIHRMRWANADMVRAIGSLYTHSVELAFWPGLITHYTVGVAFAFLYAVLLGWAPVQTTEAMIHIGLAVGLVHGVVVGLILAIAVAEHHPVERYRKAGFEVVVAHVIGHVFYGFFVALTLGLTGARLIYLNRPERGGVLGFYQDPLTFPAVWLILFGVPAVLVVYLLVGSFTARVRHQARNQEARRRLDRSA